MSPEPVVPPPSATPTLTTPVTPTERIHTLDILRGLAVLGMILVHFHFYANEFHDLPANPRTALETVISWAIWILVETKSAGTFAFLFGVGFAIQLQRSEARGARFLPLYLRRLLVLALFGFAAHALFGYNVLLGYAYAALWLLPVRKWPTQALLAAAVVSAMLPSLYSTGRHAYDRATMGPDRAIAVEEARLEAWQQRARDINARLEAAEEQPSYSITVRARLNHMRWFYAQRWFILPGYTLCLFLLGMLALRCGLLEDPRRWTRVIVGFMIFGVVSLVSERWLRPLMEEGSANPTGLSNQAQWALGLFDEGMLAFTYMGALLLFLAWRSAWVARLGPMAWVGRMALTNYLLQIMILDVLFAGYGLDLKIRDAMVAPATLVLFAGEVTLSRFWLGRFRFGPAEWLWRSLTYGRMQPLGLAKPGVAVAS
ncbi:MAG: DUF418 domain-containing protein [Gemmatimonadota bacterium]